MIKVRAKEEEYPCYICPEILNTKKDLRTHTIKIHKDEKSRVCATCNATFKEISSVRRHIKTVHVKEKQFMCALCERRYMHKYDLENHFSKKHKSRGATNDRKVCPECKNSFTLTTELIDHMQKEHKKTISFSKCPFCIKTFFDPVYLKQHFKRVHGNDPCSLIICKICPGVADNVHTFTSHMKDCHGWEMTLICTRKGCNEHFQSEDELCEHLKTHPKQTWTRKKSEESTFKCWECDVQCERREMMVSHFSSAHSCFPKFECKNCSTFFRDKDDLSLHIPCSHQPYTEFVELTITQEDAPSSSSGGNVPRKTSKKRKITPLVTGVADFQTTHIEKPKPSSSR